MTILNDKEIRARSLVPTHTYGKPNVPPLFFAQLGIFYYDVLDGKAYTKEYLEHGGNELIPMDEKALSRQKEKMITPFEPNQIKTREVAGELERIISYGTSSMGYDVRLGRKFKIFTNVKNALIDPLSISDDCYIDHEGDYVIIPPNSYVLGYTIEYFNIPDDILAICVGKSTYARAGCAINVTPIEPGFRGNIVVEIANQTTLPMKVYSSMGIAQFLFLKGNPCEISYNTRQGKYQGQTGIQTALV